MPTVELTDRFCQRPRPSTGSQTDYFDTVIKGLCLSSVAGGTKAFYLNYTQAGRWQACPHEARALS